jgi:type I restriction enzyme, S subunit
MLQRSQLREEMPQLKTKTKFKETEIGPIPEEWEVYELGDVINFNPSRTLKKGTFCKFVTMADLNPFQRQIVGYSNKEFSGGSKFQNGDTLLARITPCLENGKTSFVQILKDKEVAGGSTEFLVLAPLDNTIIDNAFIYYLFTSTSIRDLAIKSMVGSSGRQRVQEKMLAGYEISLPPLPEQKSIAEILSSLDEKIELNRRMNKTLEEIGKTLFKRWFVDFEFPNEEGKPYKSSGGEMVDSELGEIPKGWEVGSLSEFTSVKSGFPFSSSVLNETKLGSPVIKISNITENGLDLNFQYSSDIPKRAQEFQLQLGDLLIAMSGNTTGKFCLMTYDERPSYLNQRAGKFFFKDPVYKSFVYFFMLSNDFRTLILDMAYGSAQPNIGSKDFGSIPIIKPLITMIEAFAKQAEELVNQYIHNESQKLHLSSLRDVLLPKLISGKIRTSNA